MNRLSYAQLMGANKAILTLKLDTHEPVELRDFVGAFTSLANEFDRYVGREFPGTTTEPQMFIREVRQGCIEADVITGIAAAIGNMDQIIILEDFVRRWGARFTSLLSGKVPEGEIESTSELKDWADAAKSIASDPVGGHRLEAAYFEDGKREIKASFTFTAPEARTALVNIEDRKRLLTKPDHLPHERVLMVFTRSDINDAAVGKSSGERVMIEEISDRSLALMYGSEVAEGTIKREIREADENVYKKGFVVDVIVKMKSGKAVAYSVITVHSVIDLPD
ncbi:hypothetical protein [Agrobacterium pusense]|uniref:hypothetical protein n=1 Tax=Agrobacterium pusense TaxID=648995 RepID=UPI003FD43AA3